MSLKVIFFVNGVIFMKRTEYVYVFFYIFCIWIYFVCDFYIFCVWIYFVCYFCSHYSFWENSVIWKKMSANFHNALQPTIFIRKQKTKSDSYITSKKNVQNYYFHFLPFFLLFITFLHLSPYSTKNYSS